MNIRDKLSEFVRAKVNNLRYEFNRPRQFSPTVNKTLQFGQGFSSGFQEAVPGRVTEYILGKLKVPVVNPQTSAGRAGNITGNIASTMLQGVAAGRVLKPLFSAPQAKLGRYAGKVIARGGITNKIVGKGIANISQGLPYTASFNLLNRISNPQTNTGGNVLADVGFDFATGTLPLLGMGGIALRKSHIPNDKLIEILRSGRGSYDSVSGLVKITDNAGNKINLGRLSRREASNAIDFRSNNLADAGGREALFNPTTRGYAKIQPAKLKDVTKNYEENRLLKGMANSIQQEGAVGNARQGYPIGRENFLEAPQLGYKDIRGSKANSAEEIAPLLKDFRNPKEEVFHVIYVKNGEVVAHNAMSQNMPSAVGIDPQEIIYRMGERADRLGADGIYIAHNHPSGDATPSLEDIAVFNKMKEKIGSRLKGELVIDHDKVSIIGRGFPKEVAMDLGKSYQSTGVTIDGHDTLERLVREHWRPEDNKLGIFITDTKARPVGYENFSITGKSIEQINDTIRQFVRKHAGSNVFGVTNIRSLKNPLGEGLGRLGLSDLLLRDENLDRYVSLRASGVLGKRSIDTLNLYKNADNRTKGSFLFDKPSDTADEVLRRAGGIKPRAKLIPKELEPLAEEARKYKSAEEFHSAIIDKLNAVSKTRLSRKGATRITYVDPYKAEIKAETEKMLQEVSKRGMSITDFYNQAVKGIKPSGVKKLKATRAPRVASRAKNQEIEKIPSKATTQNLPKQQQGRLAQNIQEEPVSRTNLGTDRVQDSLSYADNLSQPTLRGKKTLFGYEPIETGARSVELDETGMRKIQNRAKRDAERAAKADYQRWYKAQRESGEIKTLGEQLDIISKSMQENTRGVSAKELDNLRDIGNTAKGFDTMRRIFKKVFGSSYETIEKEIVEPFYKSKADLVAETKKWTAALKNLNIKKGSEMSRNVQLFGEKKITYGDLVAKYGNEYADRVVEADKFFRQAYNTLLDEINSVRSKIYPNNPEKIIPKRANYYRHFKEMQEGVGGLKNIFETPAGISPKLVGISADTKPKSKWLSFAQKRTGDETTHDAVGGFIEYLQKALYAKNIDPNIERFRALADDLEAATLEGPNKGKLNNFIEYLHDFANDLSGKTGPIDRAVQKYIPGGRKAMRVLDWANNRVKANVILMNISSTLAQFFNIPQGVANAGALNSTKGLSRTLASIFVPNKPITKSRFIAERYQDEYAKFDTSMLDNIKKFGVWLTRVGDEIGTKFIWNAHYEKAMKEGIQNPIKYADEATESMVGGRGIGEVPLIQKDKVFQLLAPFQLEVGNLWWVMKDWVNEKQFSKLATFMVASYLMNRAAKAIRGSDVSFDPINALVEGLQAFGEEEDKKIGTLKLGGRLAGEVVSNIPGGQTVAALYPEYGFSVGETKLPSRREFFGEGDPTRFGGGLLVMTGIQDPIYKLLTPFGGQQLKKTIEGVSTVSRGASQTKGGEIQFPVDKSMSNYLKAATFGKYSLPEAQEYFAKDRRPLSTKQSEYVRGAGDMRAAYNEIISAREKDALESKVREEVRKSGQMQKTEDKYIYYDPDTDQVKSIDLKTNLTPPTLTGQSELDKEILSDYKSSISRRINDIVKLYELGVYTAEQAEEEIGKLSILKELVSQINKKPKKPSIKVSRGTVPKIKKTTRKKISLKPFKPSEESKFKVKVKAPKTYKISQAQLEKLRRGEV